MVTVSSLAKLTKIQDSLTGEGISSFLTHIATILVISGTVVSVIMFRLKERTAMFKLQALLSWEKTSHKYLLARCTKVNQTFLI